MIAKVVKWDIPRGFGFVQVATGRNYFCHIKNWLSDEPPCEGQTVSIEIGPCANGKPDMAVNVRVLPQTSVSALALLGGV